MGAMILEKIMKKLEHLPEDVQLEANSVLDAFLETKKISTESDSKNEHTRKPVFGSLKGFVTYMADDFDEPLEDFKDYM